ncbi:hypothetical protein RHMOL_Rhmol02G0193700 [Rhododendron molle]|uniref:Uncharacterized protein n=1 Tax=Rhododendron molle TaxID=49168 RepID=A0ACC0PS99_RHOML|nr:hypothetical protein RHMOL_Rhmol02G0193700 [Rhododendron molle]
MQFELLVVISECGPNASERYRDWIKQPTEHSRVWKKVNLATERRNSRPRNRWSGRGKDPAAEVLISQGDFASNRLPG